jgi:hypothetical protein
MMANLDWICGPYGRIDPRCGREEGIAARARKCSNRTQCYSVSATVGQRPQATGCPVAAVQTCNLLTLSEF